MHPRSVVPGIVGAVASVIGGAAAAVSTHDYAQHLDRRLHGTHCSFVPGLGDASSDNACTAALQSAFSAVLKDRFWGGIPISLFALGAFSFTLALSLYMMLARENASKRARLGFLLTTLGPFFASVTMFVISLAVLGQFCKVCVGIYVASAALLVAGILAVVGGRNQFANSKVDPDATAVDPEPWHLRDEKGNRRIPKTVVDDPAAAGKDRRNERPALQQTHSSAPPRPLLGSWAAPVGMLAAMGSATVVPALVYASTVPDFRDRIASCGKLLKPGASAEALVKIKTSSPTKSALTLEDPLCPNCKAFHDRLVSEGLYDKLDLRVAIFPLDSECNWMLKKPMHPGACILARAFLCADKTGGDPRAVLQWSYDNQEDLAAAGKRGPDDLKAKIRGRFPALDACIDTKEIEKRLEEVLRFAIDNNLRVSTPQLFLGDTRVCPEDTDIGLSYTIRHLAPEVKQ